MSSPLLQGDGLPAAPAPGERRRAPRYPFFFWALVALSLVALGAGAWLLWQNHQAADDRPVAAAAEAAGQVVALKPEPATDFQLTALDGHSMRLSDLRGKVVLVNFWATWCPPCQAEMPDLQALYQGNSAQHDFLILGVDVEESRVQAQAFANQYGLSFPILPDSEGQVSNFRYFIRNLPTSFIIDRAGNVRYRWSGQQSRQSMLSMLASVW